MTPIQRQKLCRQAASLLALTTSSNAGESENAGSKLREMIARDALTESEVTPFCNDVARTQLHKFWTKPQAKEQAKEAGPSFMNPYMSMGGSRADFWEELLQEQNLKEARRQQQQARYQGWQEAFQGRVDWAQTPKYTAGNVSDPFVFDPALGREVRVSTLAAKSLERLLDRCERFKNSRKLTIDRAHDYLNDEDYDSVIVLMNRLKTEEPPYPIETISALKAEYQRRQEKRDDPVAEWPF